jgi:DNA polymerase I
MLVSTSIDLKKDYTYVTAPSAAREAVRHLSNSLGLEMDLEIGDWMDERKRFIRVVTLRDGNHTFIFDLGKLGYVEELVRLLKHKPLTGFALKNDLKDLKRSFSFVPTKVFDCYLAAMMISMNRHTVKHDYASEVFRYFGVTLDKTLQQDNWTGDLTERHLAYCANDVRYLRPLRKEQTRVLNGWDRPIPAEQVDQDIAALFGLRSPAAVLEMSFLPSLVCMESNGIELDVEGMKGLWDKVGTEKDALYSAIASEYKINPNSGEQIGRAFEQLGISLPKTEKGRFSTRDFVLRDLLPHPLADKLLRLGKLENIFNNAEGVLEAVRDGRVYGDFSQLGNPTGRMSCRRYNLLAAPHECGFRDHFVARSGSGLTVADFPAIQLRIASVVMNEPRLKQCFLQGKSPHIMMAAELLHKAETDVTLAEKKVGKQANFEFVYGITDGGFKAKAWEEHQIALSAAQVRDYRKSFFTTYKGIVAYHDRVRSHFSRHDSIIVKTLLGRPLLATRFQEALNAPHQGTDNEMLKASVIRLRKRVKTYKLPVRWVLGVHDELLMETPIGLAEDVNKDVRIAIEEAGKLLRIPLDESDVKPDFVQRWSEAKH